MTFEEFQATKKEVTNLIDMQELASSLDYGEVYNPETTSYLLYIDTYIIEYDSQTEVYYVIIGNVDYTDEDLEPLEKLLYDYFVGLIPPKILTQLNIIEELIRKEEAKTVIVTFNYGEAQQDVVVQTATEEEILALKDYIVDKIHASAMEQGYCSFTVTSTK